MPVLHFKINIPMAGHNSGQIVPLPCDSLGVPLHEFWRNRYNDAKLDNCIELHKPAKQIKTAAKKESKK